MVGQMFQVRFADDFILGFTSEEDARRVLEVLPKRFGKHGLTIHPEKTRLVRFQSPARPSNGTSGGPGTFDFLGLTHYWGRSRKGRWVVKRKNGRKESAAEAITGQGMIQEGDASANSGTVPNAVRQTPGALSILRD